ncbi:MAG: tRNA-dihydrouridine synthase [Candidatus Pacebacteria bacterium]|nr:tRNA-dihydrouridine synthase [Candidatus Paceibacterota bacterium]
MTNFWAGLPQPFFALAPMADVTDPAFRHIIAKYGAPDVMWTEFVSADGLYHTREIQKLSDSENPLMRSFMYGESERPIVAQLFSSKPEMMEYGASVVTELGFDGVDINMGCPDKSVEKQKAGAALMKNPELARELIRATKRGTGDKIPVSVKTRVGYNKVELDTWLPELLAEEPAVITVHARTRKEMSEVPARWKHVREAVELRNKLQYSSDNSHTLIIGNGDVTSLKDGRVCAEEAGADGVMVGRGIFGNPWFFSGYTPTQEEKLRTLVEHCYSFEELCRHKSFAVMKKHFKAYVRDFDGASELRAKLMECKNASEVASVLGS